MSDSIIITTDCTPARTWQPKDSTFSSYLAEDLDRAGESDVASRGNLLRACGAVVENQEFGLLETFISERLDRAEMPSHRAMVEASKEILAQYK